MARKTDFTTEEWKTIVAAAPMVGLAVTCASPNGPWGVLKEMLSMGMAMAEMLQKGSSNPLIADLTADLKARQTKPEPPQDIKDPEQAKESALNHIRAVNIAVFKHEQHFIVDFRQPVDASGFASPHCCNPRPITLDIFAQPREFNLHTPHIVGIVIVGHNADCCARVVG